MKKRVGRYLAIASFVLGMLCLAVMLLLFLPYDPPDLVGTIAFYLLPVSPPLAFAAVLLGIIGYRSGGQQDDSKSKKYALVGVILSSSYWILFAIQHTMWIPGYGW